jgi:DNA repair protein RAD7
VHILGCGCGTDSAAQVLASDALCSLAHLNPNLTHLRLDFCGHMDDNVIKVWCTSLSSLKRLELFGPYLVRAPAWKSFFESHPQLEGFLITQSPRFDLECMESLASNCPHLKEIRLREVGKMEEGFLDHLKTLNGLSSLDLSEPGTSLSKEGLAELMMGLGRTLTTLDLSNHSSITDWFLEFGVKPHTRVLTSLSLRLVPHLTDEGVAKFFNTWASGDAGLTGVVSNPPLISLDLSRNEALSSAALSALLSHSGSALQKLNINGWKSTSADALNEIAQCARDLHALDIGFCREVDDFVLKAVIDKCSKIKEIKCWGCNRVTERCPRKVRWIIWSLL